MMKPILKISAAVLALFLVPAWSGATTLQSWGNAIKPESATTTPKPPPLTPCTGSTYSPYNTCRGFKVPIEVPDCNKYYVKLSDSKSVQCKTSTENADTNHFYCENGSPCKIKPPAVVR